jgi:hypothetical protein
MKILYLVLIFGVSNAFANETPITKKPCRSHFHKTGNGCKCDEGYRLVMLHKS